MQSELNRPTLLAAAHGSAKGGPEVWNVVAWGDVRECYDIATIMDEVREALELGCRTVSIERQGSPNQGQDNEALETLSPRVRGMPAEVWTSAFVGRAEAGGAKRPGGGPAPWIVDNRESLERMSDTVQR